MVVNEPSWNSFTMSTKWTSATLGVSPSSAISSAAARSDSDRSAATAPVFVAAPLNPRIFIYASQERIHTHAGGQAIVAAVTHAGRPRALIENQGQPLTTTVSSGKRPQALPYARRGTRIRSTKRQE